MKFSISNCVHCCARQRCEFHESCFFSKKCTSLVLKGLGQCYCYAHDNSLDKDAVKLCMWSDNLNEINFRASTNFCKLTKNSYFATTNCCESSILKSFARTYFRKQSFYHFFQDSSQRVRVWHRFLIAPKTYAKLYLT